VTVRRGRRRPELLDDLKKKREYCKLKEETLDRTLWRTGFGRRCGTVLDRLQNERRNAAVLFSFHVSADTHLIFIGMVSGRIRF